jgi:nitric oxide reductase NorQ protein
VATEAGIEIGIAKLIVGLGIRTRRLQGHGLDEGASTRMLVHAGILVAQGVSTQDACRMALLEALTDEPGTRQALEAALEASF